MDALGIATAAVSWLEGVWLKDSEAANTELQALVRSHQDRLLPLYTLNPAFPGWSDELERLRGAYGLPAGAAGSDCTLARTPIGSTINAWRAAWPGSRRSI
jgi:hypothetical protein